MTNNMTIEQFLKEVSKYDWQMDGKFIRSKEEIEFFYPLDQEYARGPLCPLCYVAYKLKGIKIRNSKFQEAADLLGIDEIDASDLASAADKHISTRLQQTFRDQLKLAAKLNEEIP